MKHPADVASPSDLSSFDDGVRVRIGGRAGTLTVTTFEVQDAFGAVTVTLADGETAPDQGDLVVIEADKSRGGLVGGRVVERSAGRDGAGEFERFHDRGVGPRLRARAGALEIVRRYFAGLRFVEIETPIRVISPGLDAHVDALRAEGGFLITSPEHHMKRLLVGGLPRIFQITRCFRVDEQGPLHETEFSMLEWYRAFSGHDRVIEDTESLVAQVAEGLSGSRHLRVAGRQVDVTPPFDRITVREAFREYANVSDASDLAAEDETRYFQLYVDRVEPGLARLDRAVFLTRFPASQGALARLCADDPAVVERFELVVGGVEICNGFGELTDPAEQRRRFEREHLRRQRGGGREQPIDERLLAALEEGMPPSAGNALGLDRLVALALGVDDIADVLSFPASHP